MDNKTSRAKFVCESETKHQYGLRSYVFKPVVRSDNPENDLFFKTTPGGNLEMTVKNDGVVFEVGKEYYVDFTAID